MVQSHPTHTLTRHAATRCQQRGVPWAVLSTLLDRWDRSVPVGDNRTAVSISRIEASRLRGLGLAPAALARLVSLTAVLSGDGQVVTVLHATSPRYHRPWR